MSLVHTVGRGAERAVLGGSQLGLKFATTSGSARESRGLAACLNFLKERDGPLGAPPSGGCQLFAVLFEEAKVVPSLGKW